ncbi:MAG TPA: pitrilysin family protein [Candidatus Omnitrophota bacterium]|nr:pitrilysin family protein [Candidatus Omnitrophota bacterium]HPD85050.1 pitrilysin family protein [Candidatus Omnitrophota bacterium]HRZ03908.1 pitrilysin family protein [Candidatus Omnitrophota bacterium]
MYKKTVLNNKLRVATHEMKGRDSVSVGIWIGAGGRYENTQNKGAAHFLEHIVFKGTKKYPCYAIKELIEGVGGSLNAFTDEELTCYFAKIPAKHLERTFDILTDMTLFPLVSSEDVEKERTVILEEIKMYRDLPQHFVMELLDQLMWPGHPLGMNLTGSLETVGKMSADDLEEFRETHYAPGKIVVAACGCLKHKELVDLSQKKFKGIRNKECPSFLKANNSQAESQVKFFFKDTEQMHLALGAFGLRIDHPDRHAFNLLNIVLGANMSSRLFNEIREKRGLAYSISSAIKSLKDTGILLVSAGVDNKKVTEAVEVILGELRRMKQDNITKDEFTRAKDYYLGQMLLGLEDTLEHMFWVGGQTLILNKTRKLDDILKEVKKVTIADIKRVANVIFAEKNINLAVVGPLNDIQQKDLSDSIIRF